MDVGGSLTSGSQKSAVAFSLLSLTLFVPDGLSASVYYTPCVLKTLNGRAVLKHINNYTTILNTYVPPEVVAGVCIL
jgi:hypothetical protein